MLMSNQMHGGVYTPDVLSNRWDSLVALPEFAAGEPGDAATETFFGNEQVTYDATKGGMKITFVGEGVSGTSPPTTFKLANPTYVALPTPRPSTGSILTTVDFEIDATMGRDGFVTGGKMHADAPGEGSWKAIQFLFARTHTTGTQKIWWEFRWNVDGGTATHAEIRGYRTYADQVEGQTGNEPTMPRGLQSKVYGTTRANVGAIIPYNTRVRLVTLAELSKTEADFADWNTEIALSSPAAGPLAAGTYTRFTAWLQVGTTKYCLVWQVPVDSVQGALSPYVYPDSFGMEMDSSSEHVPSSGTVRFTGVDGSVIPANTKIFTADGVQKFIVQGSWTIGSVTSGLVDAAVVSGQGSAPTGTKTGGYYANKPNGTAFTFARAAGGGSSPPTGVDDASTAQGAFTGGVDFFNENAYMWWWDKAMLQDYALPATPTDDTLIFEAIS